MTIYLVSTDNLGRGDAALGRILMRNYLYALARAEQRPKAMLFMNGGVRLTCAGSESLDDLRLLVEEGVSLLSCGTCLDYLQLKEQLAVGEVGTMLDAVAAFGEADNVVTLA